MSLKRDATSPAVGSEEDLKRRAFEGARLYLDDPTSSQSDVEDADRMGSKGDPERRSDAETVETNYHDDGTPAEHESSRLARLSKLPFDTDTSDSAKPVTLDDKVDRLTLKVDKIMEYLACKDNEALRRAHKNDKKFKKIESAHNELLDVVQQNVSDISSAKSRVAQNTISIECNEESIASINRELKIQRTTTDDIEDRMKEMTKLMKGFREEMDHVNMVQNDHSSEIRERKLLLSNIPEPKNEDCKLTAVTNLNKVLSYAILQEKPAAESSTTAGHKFRTLLIGDLDTAFRVGTVKSGRRIRDLVVTLKFNQVRQMIMDAKPFARASDTGFYINEYLSNDTKTLRAKLKSIATGAKSLGYETKLSGNRITIGKESYSSEELGSISPTILEESKQQIVVKDGIAYKGDHSIFSNFYPSPLVVDDMEFATVEQFFQYTKATLCNKGHLAQKIMLKSNPWYSKAVGKRVEATEEWNKQKMQILYRGVYAKFDQNNPLKQALLQTAGQNLYEATTDPYWGCGIDIASKKWESGDWKGSNMGGKVVMKVREEFLSEESLGHTHGSENTLINLLSLDIEETSMELESNISNSSLRQSQQGLPKNQRQQKRKSRRGTSSASQENLESNENEDNKWPSLPESQLVTQRSPKSYTDAVKSPVKESTAVDYGHGRGKGKPPAPNDKSRPSHSQPRKPGERKDNSQQNTWSLRGKRDVNKQQRGRVSNPPDRYTSNGQKHAPPTNDWANSVNLTPTQREAIAYLGLGPDSEFVRNIISSQTRRK